MDEEAVLLATYEWGPSDEAVILQEVLGITADGWYGGGTRAAHIAELEARGLSADNVPSPPPTTTTTEASSEEGSEEESEEGSEEESEEGSEEESEEGSEE